MRTFYLLCTLLITLEVNGFAVEQQIQNPVKTKSGPIVSTETELQDAIDAIPTNGSATIQLSQAFTVSSPIQINDGKRISIDGAGLTISVTIPGTSNWRIFEVTDGTTLSLFNLTLQGGALENNDLADNYGGAIYVENANLIAEDISIANTKAYKGGAIYVKNAKLQIMGKSEFTSNNAYNFGGAVYVEADETEVEIAPETEFNTNIATDAGGALYLTLAKGTINIGNDLQDSFVKFNGNEALEKCRGGGAVFITQGDDLTEELNITVKAKFEGNQCRKGGCKYTVPGIFGCFDGQGGALYVYGGSKLTIKEGTLFHDNNADGGGGLYLHNTKNIVVEKDVKFTENTAIYAGALCIYNGIMEIDGVEFNDNSVRGNGQEGNNGNGSAIFSEESTLRIINTKFQANKVTHTFTQAGMGAITNLPTSELYLENCIFSDNEAIYGGAIANNGLLDIINCSFNGNSALSLGGGIYSTGNMTVTNALFTKNTTDKYGGGIFCMSDQPVSAYILTNITLVDNTANEMGSGFFSDCKTAPIIRNSIIWGNNGSDLVNYTTQVEYEYSLIGGLTTDENGNIDGDTDPLLDTNFTLLPGSPVIDAGNNDYYDSSISPDPDLSSVNKDLAGNDRILLGRNKKAIDMGAYEYVAPIPPAIAYHSIVLNVAPGITTNYSPGTLTVNEYDNLQLIFHMDDPDIDVSEIHFMINGEEATPRSLGKGQFSYNLSRITNDHIIEIALREYPVIFAGAECIILEANNTARYGQPFTFSLTLSNQDQSGMITRVNDEEISPKSTDSQTHTFTIANVTGPVIIQVEGISCDDPTGNISTGNNIKISSHNGNMIIETLKPQCVTIYNVKGQLITTRNINGQTIISLKAGIYIVRTEEDSFKIIID